MRKQIWEIGSNGYAVMRDNQISEQREFEYMQEREALKPYLILKYNITDIENPTKLVSNLNYIVEMIIDGQVVEPVTDFTFTTLGDHEVRFKYEDSALKDPNGKVGEFNNIEALTEIVKIPANLLAFRANAFYNCSNLRKINLKTYAGSLKKLSTVLFQDCTNLEEIIWANTITTLEYGVFSNNNKIKELYLPDSITTINVPALYGMRALEKIVFSAGLQNIYPTICSGCPNVKEIVLPKSIKRIGSSAFAWCNFEKLDLSNSAVEIIESRAFSNNANLKEVILPNTVKTIAMYAFDSCPNIEKIKLSESLTEITGCNWFNTKIKDIVIPRSVTTIREYAFRNCDYLEKLDLSNSRVTTIETTAFTDCTNLKEVILPNTLTTIESGAFSLCNIEKIVFPKSLSVISGWSGYSHLKEVIIPEGVTTIGENAFGGCYNLEKAELPSTITTIEGSAFASCQNLKEIKIPDSVTSIGNSAFAGCTGIDYIYVPKTVENLGEGAFSGVTYVDIDKGNHRIKTIDNVFIDSMTDTLLGIVDLNKEVTIPETVKIIGSNSIACNNNTLIIPDNVIEVRAGALGKIENIIIGEGITNIPARFFSSKILKHITLGSNVQSIAKRAFYNYDNTSAIETITCKAIEPPTIDSYTFYYINEGGVLRVPDKTKYSSWMSTGSYYLGKYNWTIENIE